VKYATIVPGKADEIEPEVALLHTGFL